MLVKGEKLIAKKNIMNILDKGDVVEVADVRENGVFSFEFGNNFNGIGFMTIPELDEFFEKVDVEEKDDTLPIVDKIMLDSEFVMNTMFDRCSVVACKLPNGHVIVESYDFMDEEDYDEEIGFDICLDKIEDKILELENYRIQQKDYEERVSECCDCEDYDCKFNPNFHD